MLLLAAAILFAGLGQGDIRIDGPIYAWAAKHMVISGDWLNLYYDHGQTPYFNKPPLQFWLMAIAFKMLGYSTFSAKLVSVLFGIGCIAVVYAIARLRFEPSIAATAGIVLATTYSFIRNTAAVRLDAGVTFFFLVALYAGARMLLSPEHQLSYWIMLGAACGLALMIKSGVGLLCLPILIAAFAWNRRWDLLLNWRAAVAITVCGVIVLPWYLQQYYTWRDAFIDQHFRHQILGRFESSTFGATAWYAYLQDLTMRYWWFALGVYGAYQLLRERISADDYRRSWDRLLIVWAFGSLLVLHLLPRKYDRYLLLVYPALAILVAYGLSRTRFWQLWKSQVLPYLGCVALTVAIILQLSSVRLHATGYPELAQALPAINHAPGRTIYALNSVPMPLQCSVRFFGNAKVLMINASALQTLHAGEILLIPRSFNQPLPSYHAIARGKTALFLVIE
ncbi:MAG TPA: glycosyltransferase family 39 protein [Verrucomicrobiae bacterium]|nr:glycosyltransferase family 39 protein [Verrucomicrobiae bacterium]